MGNNTFFIVSKSCLLLSLAEDSGRLIGIGNEKDKRKFGERRVVGCRCRGSKGGQSQSLTEGDPD